MVKMKLWGKNQKQSMTTRSISPYAWAGLYSLLFVLVSFYVISREDADIGFHMARITGLAQAIRHFDFLPSLNFIFGNGVGYAVPMFYGQFLLYLPALIFLVTKSIKFAYAFYALMITFGNVAGSYYVFKKISHRPKLSLVIAFLVPLLYANFGYGMTAVTPLIPFLLLALYQILYQNEDSKWMLGIIIALLIQTHIISTVVLAIMSVIFIAFNARKLTASKVKSFIYSGLIGLGLSIGFLIQYVDQMKSQIFYATWTSRPFMGMSGNARSLWDTFKLLFETTTSKTSIGDSAPLMIVIGIIGIYFLVKWRELSEFSKTLLLTAIVLLVLTSNILPWNVLRYTVFGVFQWSGRLMTFIPSLILLIAVLEVKNLRVSLSFLTIGILLYISMIVVRYQEDAILFADKQETEMAAAYYGANNISGFVGLEYLSVDIEGVNGQTQPMNQMHYYDVFALHGKGYRISNVNKDYNQLRFDIDLQTEGAKTKIVLPRIWYKGYVAQYTDGAKGTQPFQEKVALTQNEKKSYQQQHRPKADTRVLHDGRAVVTVTSSGHVTIFYQKPLIVVMGMLIETVAWLIGIIMLTREFIVKGTRQLIPVQTSDKER